MADVVDFARSQHALLPHHFLPGTDSDPRDMPTNGKKNRPPTIELRALSTPVEPEGQVRGALVFDEGPSSNRSARLNGESFDQSTDYLVREFLAYRLKQSDCLDVPGLLSGRPEQRGLGNRTPLSYRPRAAQLRTPAASRNVEKVSEALQLLGDHLDTTYWEAFQQTVPADWLEIQNKAEVKNKFFTLSRDLYFSVDSRVPTTPSEEKVKWGRIIAHFCFTSQLACVAASSNRQELIPELASWLTQFITRYLRGWIERNGGWEGLISYQETLTSPKKWTDSSRSYVYGLSAVAAVGVGIFGVVLMKKYLSSPF